MSKRTILALALALAWCPQVDTPCRRHHRPEETTAPTEESTAPETTPASEAPSTTAAAPEGPYEHLARAMAGEFTGTTVEVLAQWVDGEAENFEAALEPFIDATGIDVSYEGITDYETVLSTRVDGGNAPDIAQLAQPGLMRTFAAEGHLVELSER